MLGGCRVRWPRGWGVAAAVALTPSRVVVFGDSLSDIGNIDDATLGVVPGRTYYNGRFSNGPAWVERLASDLGAPPLGPSTAGGDNFAYGGADFRRGRHRRPVHP